MMDITYRTTLQKYHFDWGQPGWELSKITLPNGATLRYVFEDFTYTSTTNTSTTLGRTQREVMDRYLSYLGDGNEYQYHMERDYAATTPGFFVHSKTRVHDCGAGTPGNCLVGEPVKIYAFNYDPVAIAPNYWLMGLQNEYWEKADGSNALLDKVITWTRDNSPSANPYISQVTSAPDQNYTPSTQMTTQQTLDGYGNVTLMKIFDYGNHTTPMRTYTNTYLDSGYCSTYHICNRLLASQVTDGTNSLTLVTNTYDVGGVSAPPAGLQEYDSACPTCANNFRGNVTTIAQPGTTTTLTYNGMGAVTASTTNGLTTTVTQS